MIPYSFSLIPHPPLPSSVRFSSVRTISNSPDDARRQRFLHPGDFSQPSSSLVSERQRLQRREGRRLQRRRRTTMRTRTFDILEARRVHLFVRLFSRVGRRIVYVSSTLTWQAISILSTIEQSSTLKLFFVPLRYL